MRILLVLMMILFVGGCASEGPYGVPYSVWMELTPDQKAQLAKYDAKRNAATTAKSASWSKASTL